MHSHEAPGLVYGIWLWVPVLLLLMLGGLLLPREEEEERDLQPEEES